MEQHPEGPATGRRQEELAIQYAPWAELEGGGGAELRVAMANFEKEEEDIAARDAYGGGLTLRRKIQESGENGFNTSAGKLYEPAKYIHLGEVSSKVDPARRKGWRNLRRAGLLAFAIIAAGCTYIVLLLLRTNASVLPNSIRVGFEDGEIQVYFISKPRLETPPPDFPTFFNASFRRR